MPQQRDGDTLDRQLPLFLEEELPLFLRVEEAARILRISRSAAYEQANAFLATGGRTGLPAIRLGRSLRVPRTAIERFFAVGIGAGDKA